LSAPESIKSNPQHEQVMPGCWANVSNQDYHASEGESKTSICHVLDSIEHYLMYQRIEQEQTSALLIGSGWHTRSLEPDLFNDLYRVGPTKTKTAKAWKDFANDNPDKVILTQSEYDKVKRMTDAVYWNPGMAEYLSAKSSLRETSIWVRHEPTNLLIKCRPDLICRGHVIDLKSTSGGMGLYSIKTNCLKYNYHVQAALYTDICEQIGIKVQDFLFFFCQSKPPYLTAIYRLSQDDVNWGRCEYNWALNRLARYQLGEDRWTGLPYGREIVEL